MKMKPMWIRRHGESLPDDMMETPVYTVDNDGVHAGYVCMELTTRCKRASTAIARFEAAFADVDWTVKDGRGPFDTLRRMAATGVTTLGVDRKYTVAIDRCGDLWRILFWYSIAHMHNVRRRVEYAEQPRRNDSKKSWYGVTFRDVPELRRIVRILRRKGFKPSRIGRLTRQYVDGRGLKIIITQI